MILKFKNSRRGGIVVETAIILTVIALLVVIAIPVYHNRPDAARIARAEADILLLADAQQRAAEAIGAYLPLQVLDDLAVEGERLTPEVDALANEPGALKLVPAGLTSDGEISDQADLAGSADALGGWNGPYAQTKRVYLGEAGVSMDLGLLTAEMVRRDYPVDPWGNPYRFYSPMGLIGSRSAETGTEALDSDEFSDGVLTTKDDRFDTFAIVSYGPNGESDSVSEVDDDIIYLFENPAQGEAPEA